ncbi:MAG TPA: SGNH/GDSL hydrolase family protein [Puia sp.]|nr:SGNH/GDSL hydrolase family protein [Puia sp.]
MKTSYILLAIMLCGSQVPAQSPAASQTHALIIKSNDPRIHYMGRIMRNDSAAILSWTATSVSINFTGSGAKALMRDEKGDNYYNVVVDGRVVEVIHPDKSMQLYTLASGLGPGKHHLELFKRTESVMGMTWLYHFEFDRNTLIAAATPVKKRKIEFFGNSITCGYAVEDTTGKDRGTSPYENAYISYAAITARHFDAELYSTSKTGIGITISWFPMVMQEMYDRLDAANPEGKWDFSKYRPDLVVINLFQNDSWLVKMPDHEQFKARFGTTAPSADQLINAYKAFLVSVRGKYPQAKILCALGNMDATRSGGPWEGYIEKAVSAMHDKAIYTHFFPYKNTPGHPSAKEQQTMANDLIAWIGKNIEW